MRFPEDLTMKNGSTLYKHQDASTVAIQLLVLRL
jgi:hypothetical protein